MKRPPEPGEHDDAPDDQRADPDVPTEVEQGLAYAFGEHGQPDPAPSVIERIGELTGSRPGVHLRDDQAGDTPMLKPLGPGDTREAGRYIVHGELGRGGVGAVHRGHDRDLGRDVAMKFLHERYRDDAAILNRFVEEAQIGGQLQHPGIVPVYDLGLVDGKPFFAMKLVKGQTLARMLAERESPESDRRELLSIFEAVCQTLAYAHARGVVHRDLKPANVMIGRFGEVQVVDWGMGKVLASGGTADEVLAADRQAAHSVVQTVRSDGRGSQSIVGSVMGTPAYMPPEQARGDVEHMDERSDVFALGAILCEILTGKPPYVASNRDDLVGMAAMAKQDDAHARLAACGAEPALVELATGCLMPAPAARPRSAEVVAKAVHEHLAAVETRVHEARIEAAEARVRAESLKRTQRYGIGLTAVIAAGLCVSLWFWRAAETAATNERLAREAAVASAESDRLARAAADASAEKARRNEERAVEQTQVAERERDRAVEIKRLITEMLTSVRPGQARGADTTLLKGILDATAKRLDEGAIEDEGVAAELHSLVGWVYSCLGYFDEAGKHLVPALETLQRLHEEGDPDLVTAVQRVSFHYQTTGQYAEASALLERAVETTRRVLGDDHASTIGLEGFLGNAYTGQGRYAEAEALELEVLEACKRVWGEESSATLETLMALAESTRGQGRDAEAVAYLLQATDLQERVGKPEDIAWFRCRIGLAELYSAQARYAEAEPIYLETLDALERVMGEEHPNTLALRSSLAGLYAKQGRYAEADALRLETLAISRRVLGEEHLGTLACLANLANSYVAQGRADEAEPLALQAAEGMKRVVGADHPRTLEAIDILGSCYNAMGRYDEAANVLEGCLAARRRVLGEAHPSIVDTLAQREVAYRGLGRVEDVEKLVREEQGRRLGQVIAAADAEDPDAAVLNMAAWLLLTVEDESLRDPGRALDFARRACALAEAAGSNQLWTYLDTLALAQHGTGDDTAAAETQRRALALMPTGADPDVASRLAEYEAALDHD